MKISDEQILETLREVLDYADGGYVCDTAPDKVVKAGRLLIEKLQIPEINIEGCIFSGKNIDGFEPIELEELKGHPGIMTVKKINLQNWQCFGPIKDVYSK